MGMEIGLAMNLKARPIAALRFIPLWHCWQPPSFTDRVLKWSVVGDTLCLSSRGHSEASLWRVWECSIWTCMRLTKRMWETGCNIGVPFFSETSTADWISNIVSFWIYYVIWYVNSNLNTALEICSSKHISLQKDFFLDWTSLNTFILVWVDNVHWVFKWRGSHCYRFTHATLQKFQLCFL